MLAFVFPGQGSQHRGMGQGLFDEVREFASIEPQIDALLGYSLRRLCLDDAHERLKETQYTQPCLFVVNALHYYKARKEGASPAWLAGHSLGEYNALLAAGVLDLVTGVRLVMKRGELMARAKNGSMAAILGLDADRVTRVIREGGFGMIDVANFNSPSQIVISGPVADLNRAGPVFEKAGARMYMPLPVSAAFHSRYVAEAARAFEDFLKPLSFSAPRIPVIANVTGEPYPTVNASEVIKATLVRQITSSVRWTQTMQYLVARGVTDFKEIGPGNVLTRLIQQMRQPGGVSATPMSRPAARA